MRWKAILPVDTQPYFLSVAGGSKKRKRTYLLGRKSFKLLVHPVGFEPTTPGFEVRCSIQLSYGCILCGAKWIPRSLLKVNGNVSEKVISVINTLLTDRIDLLYFNCSR